MLSSSLSDSDSTIIICLLDFDLSIFFIFLFSSDCLIPDGSLEWGISILFWIANSYNFLFAGVLVSQFNLDVILSLIIQCNALAISFSCLLAISLFQVRPTSPAIFLVPKFISISM